MTVGRRYLLGLTVVLVIAAACGALLPAAARVGVWAALAIGLLLQAPLGWWLVRVVGTPRFLLVWAVGIIARFAAVAGGALVIAPRLQLQLGTFSLALVAVLMAFVGVEAAALEVRG